MDIVIVVAIARNGVIGRDGGLPWRLSTDLRRFKATTSGSPVIMGRRTYDSIGKPLPNRLNIVVTRNTGWARDGVTAAHSLDQAVELARQGAADMPDATGIYVIGGGQIYEEALPQADRLDVTHVQADVEGDTRFPPIDPALWRAAASSDHPSGEKDSHPTHHVMYERITSA